MSNSKSATIFFCALLCGGCGPRTWVPVNTGREYGNPKTPALVSHLAKKNQWTIKITKPHNVLEKMLCFDYKCRRMIGRRKSLREISFEDFEKRIVKNAKAGVYKNMFPRALAENDTTRISPAELASGTKSLLQLDSTITLSSEILFEKNSYKLNSKQTSHLDSLSKFLVSQPMLEITVIGHTDSTGNERDNVKLSMRRAEVVAEYLINSRVSHDKIFFEGLGSSQPIGRNNTEESRRKNRRVEIILRGLKRK